MKKIIPIFAIALSLGFIAGCAQKKAEQACEDYLSAAADCDSGATVDDSVCDSVDKEHLDYFECLRDWAEGGCETIPTCTI